MRILFCNYEYPPLGGGGGVINAALAKELAKRHKVTVLTSRAFNLQEDEMVDGVRVIRVPAYFRREMASANVPSMASYLVFGTLKGLHLLRTESFDIINTHFALPTGPVGRVLARAGRIPNVLSVHGGDIFDPSKQLSPHRHFLFRSMIRSVIKHADQVIAQSENTRENVLRYYTRDYPVDLIPLGIEEPQLIGADAATRRDLGFGDDDVLFVTIGRLVARKQVEQLLKVMRDLGDSNAKLVVVGAGPESEKLKALAEQYGVSERVCWTGFVDEAVKKQILNVSDVFVSTSEHEGFGLVFLEAMAYGLPVVCYDHGGQTDFLRSGTNGYVIRLNDTDAFCGQCATLAADSSLRADLGKNNKRDVRQFFIDECARRYESKFEEVLRRTIG